MSAARTGPSPADRRQQGRRRILRTLLLAGGVLGAALSGFLPLALGRRPRLRPPGALEEQDFLSACIKCGQCVQVCPVQAIKLADLDDGIGVGVPHIEPRSQACDFSCDAVQCVLACPTGALTYLREPDATQRPGAQLASAPALKAKLGGPQSTLNLQDRMGVARLVRPESCLAARGQGVHGPARGPGFRGKLRYSDIDRWKPRPVAGHAYDLTECDLCVRECPIQGAISMQVVVDASGRQRHQPQVHEACVGCGVCEMVCPVAAPCIEVGPREAWTA